MAGECHDEPAQTPEWNPWTMPPAPSTAGGSIDIVALFAPTASLAGQMYGVADRLCEEVSAITHGRARLQLCPQQLSGWPSAQVPEGARQLPVGFDGWVYGSVAILPDPTDTTRPGLPDMLAHE